jgi:stress response protein SCP2
MIYNANITKTLIKRTLKVPLPEGTEATNLPKWNGKAGVLTRQLDIALMSEGFKLSKDLTEKLPSLHPAELNDLANHTLEAVRELVGSHATHNTYFKEFPKNIPDTMEFWMGCIADALQSDNGSRVMRQLALGQVNLLDLPKYGKYLHSYEEMAEAHDKFITAASDRITLLHAGRPRPVEVLALYHSLAGSRTPLKPEDLELLKLLADVCADDEQPEAFPMRENKAVVNAVRLESGSLLLVDTLTDILRLASLVSGGDVTLEKSSKFKMPRRTRAVLMATIEDVLTQSPNKIMDVAQYAERWKRLAEYIHPHEYNAPKAQEAFAVARGDKKAPSLASKVETAFKKKDVVGAAKILSNTPGMLARNLDRIFRQASSNEIVKLLDTVEKSLPKISGRVLLSLREHLQNRQKAQVGRIFANTKGTVYVSPDERGTLDERVTTEAMKLIDAEIMRRLPQLDLILDPAIRDVALPLSSKQTANGFAVMPRGSKIPVTLGTLRFFCYWKEAARTTDFDLSAQMLSETYELAEHIAYTNLKTYSARHSGDITSAPNGATEFIDIDLAKMPYPFIVPQINIFSGESFGEVEESFFGFMERAKEQEGLPFEPRTVRTKSDIRDKGKVSLPLVFIREEGQWFAKWTHVYLKGQPRFNQVENNHLSTSLIMRNIVERDYLTMGYLIDMLIAKAHSAQEPKDALELPNATYIGLETPDGLADDTKVINLTNLQDILPE